MTTQPIPLSEESVGEDVQATRNPKLDAIKGILIILVVIGHYQAGMLHDIIFLFHMPCFFVLSGFVYNENSEFGMAYIRKCVRRYLLPYIFYAVMVLVVLDHDFSLWHIVRLTYGGRAVSGVYWYMTCLVFALLLFTFIRDQFSDKTVRLLILVGGGISSN